jgi:hypothetical protein
MNKHIFSLTGIILLNVACLNTNKEEEKKANAQQTVSTLVTQVSETSPPSEERDVMFYYKKYADVDSEDPAIGVGPRTIVSKDIEKGIVKYKFKEAFDGENPIQTLQLWHFEGYDYIEYPGGYSIIEGEKEFPIFVEDGPMKLVKKVIDNRTARGGECEYDESPDIKVLNNKICVILTCSDDPNFAETIGTISLKNGKLVVK